MTHLNGCFNVSAGSAMYEHAMRLGQEVSGLDSLQKQVETSLKLRPVKPVLFSESCKVLVICFPFYFLFLVSGQMLFSSNEFPPACRLQECLDCKAFGQSQHQSK